MIFSSVAENQENMIFTLSVFTKMLFFMQRFVYKRARQLFLGYYKIMSEWLIYIFNISLIGGLISLWSRGFTIIQNRYQYNCYQILNR